MTVTEKRPKTRNASDNPAGFLTLQMKPGETELLRLRNQTNAISALAELVWNALDADAKRIQVDWSENSMHGVDFITVTDDGHGIAFDEKNPDDHVFMTLGDSDKHTIVHQSPEGRMLHGRFGKGRLRALALGGVIRWETVFAKTPKSNKAYSITATVGESTMEFSPLKTTKAHTGTIATVTWVSDKGNGLEEAEVRERFALIFSEYLANYTDVELLVQGHRLDPSTMIEERHDLGEYATEFEGEETIDWGLRCVQWSNPVSEARGRLFLCDQNKVVIAEYELSLRGSADYTFYLDCSHTREWEEDGLIALRNDAQQVLLAARLEAHRFLRRSFPDRAQSLTEELREQRIYPYPSVARSPKQEAEAKLFAKFALHIKQSVGSYDKMNLDNKRLLFKFMQDVLERDPGRVANIISGVLRLTAEDRKALKALGEGQLEA